MSDKVIIEVRDSEGELITSVTGRYVSIKIHGTGWRGDVMDRIVFDKPVMVEKENSLTVRKV